MNEEEKGKLIAAVKRDCKITWSNSETEKEIEEKVEDSIEMVAHKLGMHEDEKEDFTKPGYARTLLLKRCWYAWNKMENEWEPNYRQEIITARHIYEVKHGKEDTE